MFSEESTNYLFGDLDILDHDVEIFKEDQNDILSDNQEKFLINEDIDNSNDIDDKIEPNNLSNPIHDLINIPYEIPLNKNESISIVRDNDIKDFLKSHLGKGINKEILRKLNKDSLFEIFSNDGFMKMNSRNKLRIDRESSVYEKKELSSKSIKSFEFSIDKIVNKSEIFTKIKSKSSLKRINIRKKKHVYNLYNFNSTLYIRFEIVYSRIF